MPAKTFTGMARSQFYFVNRRFIPAHRSGNSLGDSAQCALRELRQNQQRHAAAQQVVQMNGHLVARAKQQIRVDEWQRGHDAPGQTRIACHAKQHFMVCVCRGGVSAIWRILHRYRTALPER